MYKNSGTKDQVPGTECNTSTNKGTKDYVSATERNTNTNLWFSSFVLNNHFMEMLYCLIDNVLKQSRLSKNRS